MATEQTTRADAPAESPRATQMVIGGETRRCRRRPDLRDRQPRDRPGHRHRAPRRQGRRRPGGRGRPAAFDDRKGWASWAAGKRGRSLAKLADPDQEHLEELAQLETRNGGKPITERAARSSASASCLDYYAGAANKIFGQTIPVSKPGLDLTLASRSAWSG